jgi:hypothetical protein
MVLIKPLDGTGITLDDADLLEDGRFIDRSGVLGDLNLWPAPLDYVTALVILIK